METKKINPVQILSVVCAVLLLVTLVIQFLPFWDIGGKSVNIIDYVWNPLHHEDLTQQLVEQVDETFSINRFIGVPVLQLFAAILGIVLSFTMSKYPISGLAALISGFSAVGFYAAEAVCHVGSMWQLHLILNACIGLVGIAHVVVFVVMFIKAVGLNKNTWRRLVSGRF